MHGFFKKILDYLGRQLESSSPEPSISISHPFIASCSQSWDVLIQWASLYILNYVCHMMVHSAILERSFLEHFTICLNNLVLSQQSLLFGTLSKAFRNFKYAVQPQATLSYWLLLFGEGAAVVQWANCLLLQPRPLWALSQWDEWSSSVIGLSYLPGLQTTQNGPPGSSR